MTIRFLTLLMLFIAVDSVFADTIAIVNVGVISMEDEGVREAQTVIVADGRIATIGDVDATPVPKVATVVDGTDRFLVPGLTEMHGHVPAADSVDLRRTLALFVANGVTTVRGMLGQPAHLDLRERIRSGAELGPRLITSGPSFNGRSVADAQAGAAMVRSQQAAGYDFLKIHPGLSRAEFDAIAATAEEIGIPFAGHVPEDVGVERALDAGIATIDHLDGYMESLLPANEDPSGGVGGFFGVFIADQAKPERIPEIAALTAAAGTWNVPTDSLFAHVTSPDLDTGQLADRPEMKYMPVATVDRWRAARDELLNDANYDPATARRAIELRRELILALRNAGAGLLLGSDSPQIFNVPGFALHHELEYMVQAGLTPYEALKAGTVGPAEFFRSDAFGTITPGKEADLLLLDANPLIDIANSRRIHGVMLRGRWMPREELDALLASYKR
jgi:imidazolonepropionase-like amidohydrolase